MADNPGTTSTEVPARAAFHNEGKTLASWVAMTGVVIGALISSFGFLDFTTMTIAVGGVVVLVSLLLGAVLRAVGKGQPKHPRA
jgi:uncharacterized membrane protein